MSMRAPPSAHRGGNTLAVLLDVGDALADVALAMPGAAVVAGRATVQDRSVQVPPHEFAPLCAGG
jgi:hypothetical protein